MASGHNIDREPSRHKAQKGVRSGLDVASSMKGQFCRERVGFLTVSGYQVEGRSRCRRHLTNRSCFSIDAVAKVQLLG